MSMIKYSCLAMILCTCTAHAAQPSAREPFEIALAAVSDSTNQIFRYCTGIPNRTPLAKLADSLIKNNGKLTVATMKNFCATAGFEKPNVTCAANANMYIGDTKITPGAEYPVCELLLSDIQHRHNTLVQQYANVTTKPGTYIIRYNDANDPVTKNRRVYKIVNVVPGSTDVYLISSDNKTLSYLAYNGKAIKTRTPDMFVNIDANNNRVGAFNDSYIFLEDFTAPIKKIISTGKGGWGYSIGGFVTLFDSDSDYAKIPIVGEYVGKHDVKRTIGETDYMPAPQKKLGTNASRSAAHANGVVFEGELVTFDYLGHWLAGASGQESKADEKIGAVVAKVADKPHLAQENAMYNVAINKLQKDTNGTNTEPMHQIRAQQEGMAAAKKMDNAVVRVFKDTKTSKKEDAFDMAKDYIIKNKSQFKFAGNKSQIKCTGDCNYTGQDVVACSGPGSLFIEFEFDSICKAWGLF